MLFSAGDILFHVLIRLIPYPLSCVVGIETRSRYEATQTANAREFLSHLAQNHPWSDIFGAQGRLGVRLLNLKAKVGAFLGSF